MAGPCLMDGDCTEFYMDGDNLRVDLVVDPSTANAATCGLTGLFVPKHRVRYVENRNNVTSGGGVVFAFATLVIDMIDYADTHAADAFGNITTPNVLTYTNTTARPEIVEFGFTMGSSAFRQRMGWDFQVGMTMSWSGPDALTPVTNTRLPIGLRTGLDVFNPAYESTGLDACLGVTLPPVYFNQRTIMQPGESLSVTRRMFAWYAGEGAPDGAENQGVSILYGGGHYIMSWTQG